MRLNNSSLDRPHMPFTCLGSRCGKALSTEVGAFNLRELTTYGLGRWHPTVSRPTHQDFFQGGPIGVMHGPAPRPVLGRESRHGLPGRQGGFQEMAAECFPSPD